MSEIEDIERAEKHLDTEPDLTAYMIRDLSIAKELKYDDLLGLLASNYYGCHKNDLTDMIGKMKEALKHKEQPNDPT